MRSERRKSGRRLRRKAPLRGGPLFLCILLIAPLLAVPSLLCAQEAPSPDGVEIADENTDAPEAGQDAGSPSPSETADKGLMNKKDRLALVLAILGGIVLAGTLMYSRRRR